MGYANCEHYAGLVETLKVVSIISLALCQTRYKQVPVFSRLSNPVDNFGAVVGENHTPYGILTLWAVNGLSIVYWVNMYAVMP